VTPRIAKIKRVVGTVSYGDLAEATSQLEPLNWSPQRRYGDMRST